MERRILKDFQIGFIEGMMSEAAEGKKADIFSSIAKSVGKKSVKKYVSFLLFFSHALQKL